MNKVERIKMLRSMEFIARQINDEDVFENWLICGVGDGDINEDTKDEDLEYYLDDDTFEGIMHTFLMCMKQTLKSGGLYCDGVVTKDKG